MLTPVGWPFCLSILPAHGRCLGKDDQRSQGSNGTPSEEVINTILSKAESMVNSKQFTYVHLETSRLLALTPNYFTLLSSNGVKQSEEVPTTEGKSLRNLTRFILDKF